jgi:hypothetical protein
VKGVGELRSFTVDAKSLASARGLYQALSGFHPELSGSDQEGYRVTVDLGSSDQQVIAVLNAIVGHVTARNDGPARVELDGKRYTLEAG